MKKIVIVRPGEWSGLDSAVGSGTLTFEGVAQMRAAGEYVRSLVTGVVRLMCAEEGPMVANALILADAIKCNRIQHDIRLGSGKNGEDAFSLTREKDREGIDVLVLVIGYQQLLETMVLCAKDFQPRPTLSLRVGKGEVVVIDNEKQMVSHWMGRPLKP